MTDEHYKLDDFDFGRKLGEGATGEVFVVSPRSHVAARFPLPKYALKAYKPAFFAFPDGLDRLARERALLEGIRHPNIVHYEHVEIREGNVFAVSEFCDASDLTSVRDISDPRAIIRDVATALQYLHGVGILHRDIKPENVLVNEGVAKLCDFGVARGLRDSTLTATNQFLGTIRYAPPEYLFDQSYFEASDLYGLGHIAYWLCTGEALVSAALPFAQQVLLVRSLKYPGISTPVRFPNGILIDQLIRSLLYTDPQSRIRIETILRIVDMPDLSEPEQGAVLAHFSHLSTEKDLLNPVRWIDRIPEAERRLGKARHMLEQIARGAGYPLRPTASPRGASERDRSASVGLVAAYLAAAPGDRNVILQDARLVRNPNLAENNPDAALLSNEDRTVLLCVAEMIPSNAREPLVQILNDDSTATQLIREAFIENGDPGDSEAYRQHYELNDRLGTAIRRVHRIETI